LEKIGDKITTASFYAERACSKALGGDCHSAIAIYSTLRNESLHLSAKVLSLDGAQCIFAEDTSNKSEAIQLGKSVGAMLEAKGALKLIQQVKDAGLTVA
jgi:hydroxymethylbilane synthase